MADEAQKEEAKEGKKKKKGIKLPKLSIAAMLPKLILLTNVVGMGVGGYLAYLGTIGMTPETIREMEARKLIYNEEIFKGATNQFVDEFSFSDSLASN